MTFFYNTPRYPVFINAYVLAVFEMRLYYLRTIILQYILWFYVLITIQQNLKMFVLCTYNILKVHSVTELQSTLITIFEVCDNNEYF